MLKDAIPPAVLEALKAGDKIAAIKLLRQVTGIGLKESKTWIEALGPRGAAPPQPTEFEKANPTEDRFTGHAAGAHGLRSARPGLSPGEVEHSGGTGKWFALIAIGAAVVAAVLSS